MQACVVYVCILQLFDPQQRLDYDNVELFMFAVGLEWQNARRIDKDSRVHSSVRRLVDGCQGIIFKIINTDAALRYVHVHQDLSNSQDMSPTPSTPSHIAIFAANPNRRNNKSLRVYTHVVHKVTMFP